MLLLLLLLLHLVTDAAPFPIIPIAGGERVQKNCNNDNQKRRQRCWVPIVSHRSLFSKAASASVSSPSKIRIAPKRRLSSSFLSAKLTFSKRILVARFVVGFLLFFAGYRTGCASVSVTAVRAVAVASSSSSRWLTTNVVLTVALSLFVGRDLWRSIPAWAKPSLIRRSIADTRRLLGIRHHNNTVDGSQHNIDAGVGDNNYNKNNSEDDDDAMSDFTKLASKFNSVLEVAQRRLPSKTLNDINWTACFIALLQLLQQQDTTKRRAVDRDTRYHQSGRPVTTTTILTAENVLRKEGHSSTTRRATHDDTIGLDEWMDIADSSYNELPNKESIGNYVKNKGYHLIKHDQTVLPGYLSHYVAIHHTEKRAIISIKGTSTVEDLITDMCGSAVSHHLVDGPFVPDGPTTIRAHEGILLSSLRLTEELQPLIENLLLPQGYRITIVGHSLGAAGAALLAVLLRSRIPKLQQEQQQQQQQLYSLNVLAFGSPPVLDYTSAVACESFVTTIINNSDVIARCNAGPMLVLVEALTIINTKLQQKPDEVSVATRRGRSQQLDIPAAIKLLSSTIKNQNRRRQKSMKNQKIYDVDHDDNDKSNLTYEEVTEAFETALDKFGCAGEDDDDIDQLYVAGKVILMYNSWVDAFNFNNKKQPQQQQPSSSDNGRKGGEQKDDNEVFVEDQKFDYSATKSVLITNPAANVLRYIELDVRMLEDHMAPSYKNSLRLLCQQPE